MQRYTLKGGRLDPDRVEAERTALREAIEATLGAWRGRRASPVYQQLPNLREPDWKTLKVGDVNEFWQALEKWQSRVEVARRKQRPGDILVLAEETPNSVLEFEALRTAARALIRLNRPRYALNILERARQLEPDDVEARQLEGIALGRAERYAEARESLRRLAEEHKDGETWVSSHAPGRMSGRRFGTRIHSASWTPSPLPVTRRRRCKAPPPLISRPFVPLPASIIRESTR